MKLTDKKKLKKNLNLAVRRKLGSYRVFKVKQDILVEIDRRIKKYSKIMNITTNIINRESLLVMINEADQIKQFIKQLK